ncbi:glyoxalase [Gordonia sp. PKS22-38]|uniref:Glyoxalase n=1 Tax=Gordonia prachuapensis TaxID=3115651 RepID=A0ABU7MUE4_9ACTN|nr:glyoxalase [Gordonia sp. PKS22-38]
MTSINSLSLEVPDTTQAKTFYDKAFGLGERLRFRVADGPSTGFRGHVLSLVVPDPAVVDSLFGPALDEGATEIKPAKKSFWGYGGVLRVPDGAIWKVASSSKKDTGAPARQVDDIVVLIGAADVAASKSFYVDHGLDVAKSFGRKYVEFVADPGSIKLALYGRKAAAKDAGVDPAGSGSHRVEINSDAGAFVDPDGFVWQSETVGTRSM